MDIGDKVYFYSSRVLPLGGVAHTGVIVEKIRHPDYQNSDDLAKFRVRLDRRLFWLFPVYEWLREGEIFGWKPAKPNRAATEIEQLEKMLSD